MTIREAKLSGLKRLRRASGREAALESEILLAHSLGISREELLAHDERRAPAFALRRFTALIARRVRHEPIAYLIGHKEFFGLQFAVNGQVLIPRPETELIVEEALKIIAANPLPAIRPPSPRRGEGYRERAYLVIDVGTGSGAIAIAIAKNAPGTTVVATDISPQALKLAERNAETNDVADRIVFCRSDLLLKLSRSYQLENSFIVANLPYLPTKVWQKCAPDVKKFEPRSALEGGPDGLKYYDRLFHQMTERNIGATMICEIDPSQKKSFPKLAKRHFPNAKVEIKNDLAGLPRIAIIKK